jgi:ABC-type amino acid transport substrate-binding protein
MSRGKKIGVFLLLGAMLLSLCACGTTEKYKIVKTLAKQEYYIGFRKDDALSYYVTGALKVMQADGTVSALSEKWFGDDRVAFASDADGLKNAGTINARTLLIGVDENAYPMSYVENGQYAGFDVELARALCQKLGWEPQFISIQTKDAYVELSSGNVDVAWGGLALDGKAEDYTVFGPYMENSIVIAALSGSSSGISGKTLVMDVSQDSMDALDANENVKNKFGKITRSTGNTLANFASLDSGACDMVLTDSTAVDYLNNH